MHRFYFFLIFFTVFIPAFSVVIQDKVLICGIGKNVERAMPNTIRSAEALGSQFLDYRVIIYENNSKDKTKEMLKKWAKKNPHVICISENISERKICKKMCMKVRNRTEILAWARNRVLDVAMQDQFKDFKYVIW